MKNLLTTNLIYRRCLYLFRELSSCFEFHFFIILKSLKMDNPHKCKQEKKQRGDCLYMISKLKICHRRKIERRKIKSALE